MSHGESPASEGGARNKSVRLRVATLVGLVLIAAALAIWLWPRNTPPPPLDDDDDIDKLLAVVNPGYVGINTCAECHAERVAEFKTTRHYVACLPATGVTAPGFTPGRGRFDTKVPGLHYEMTRSGAECSMTAVETAGGKETRVAHSIGLVYGSGSTRDEMYFAWKEDRLYHLPVAWLFPAECWGTATDTPEVLEAGPSCLQCHNTWMAHIPGTPNKFRRDDMLLGVTCERCHGPGREHAEHHRKHPKAAAHGILHPGTLSRERLMDVCAQCHGNTRIAGMPFMYRPGQPLETGYRTLKAKYREDDTTTNQVQYLSESKCFQKSEMTCITCHDPHTPTSPHSTCTTCHKAASCPDQPKQPAAVRGDCVGCHMPRHIWMNSHYYTTEKDRYFPVAPRSEHRIGVYPRAKQAVVLAWLRKQTDAKSQAEAEQLAADLSKDWLKEAEALRGVGRLKAALGAFREALEIDPNPAVRARLEEVIKRQVEVDDLFAQLPKASDHGKRVELLKRALSIRPDDARGHLELGKVYVAMGRPKEAIAHLRAVAEHDPSDSSGLTELAFLADMEGRPGEAAAFCAKAEKVEPDHPGNHYVWGQALLKLKNWADAEKHFRITLKTNPTDGSANQGLSEALRQQGQSLEAVRFAKRAAHWADPKNAHVLLTLADAYVALKRLPEARKALERALPVAQRHNPPLAREISRRIDELR